MAEHEHISCQEVVELVTDYLDRTLPADEAALFEQHINFCDGCDSDGVCESLEITQGNQRVVLHRARAQVRTALERHLDA